MMNPEMKAKWVAALRSGDYKQGRNILNRNNEEFCCLGVLCEILGLKKTPIGDNKPDYNYHFTYNDYKASKNGGTIPDFYCPVIGLNPDEKGKLIILNDTNKMSFAEIADYIEEKL